MPRTVTSSPSRPLRSKRESMTITRSVGKAFADVINKEKQAATDSEAASTSSIRTRATTAAATKSSRLSLEGNRNSMIGDKSKTPSAKVLVKKTAPSSTSKSTRGTMGPPPPPSASKASPEAKSPSEKAAKPRSSLTFRGLSSALQSKPSSLPKYKGKPSKTEASPVTNGSSKKRPSNWDEGKSSVSVREEEAEDSKDSGEASTDSDDDFVEVSRPISPLPKRALRKPMGPVSVSLTPSTPAKKSIFHKATSSLSSISPKSKLPKTSTSPSPVSRLKMVQTISRPSSAASTTSRATPGPRKAVSPTKGRVTPARRRPRASSPASTTTSKLEMSPNPFHVPDAGNSSLLSPPLSPFLEGVSLDSIDAGDVSALLETVVSPTKPSTAPSEVGSEPAPPPPHSQGGSFLRIFPERDSAFPPQTPVTTTRTSSILSTDPRQSVLSLRQLLENSGDLEHLLSAPLPSLFTPEARERLLSFGFSPEMQPPPISSILNRPEPETPSPHSTERGFSSISQVLFPSIETRQGSPTRSHRPQLEEENERLKGELATAEEDRLMKDSRIADLERQLTISRDAREQEANDLAMQVSELEERIQELLADREQSVEQRALDVEAQLKERDEEWRKELAATVAKVQEESVAERGVQRRVEGVKKVSSAWEDVIKTASCELELLRMNRQFIEITLAGLDISIARMQAELMH